MFKSVTTWEKLQLSNVNSFVFLLTTIIIICGQINVISSSSSSECGEHEFKCHSDGKCIKTEDVCNRKKDCADNSDEDCDLCLAPNWHQCAGGQACISASFLCDGQEHCPDGDDEDNCDGHEHIHEKCGKYEYTCLDKACIPLDMVCDGRKQCADGSDETIGCLHAEEQRKGFFCHNKRYLESHTWVCDGYDDCGDESDEQGCAWNCKPEKDKFLCKDNDTCIPLSNVCDKVPQCPDKSDENGLCSDLKLNCQTNLCPEPSKCHQLPDTGPTCICPKGYKYDLVKRQCEDIDECQNYGICSQMCTNINGSFECSCAEKYILKNDGRTCAVQGGEPLLLYTTEKSLVVINLKLRHVYKVADNLTQVIGVAYDGEHIYWTNIQHQLESLVRSREDGSEQEILLTSGIEAPEDLAIDWLTGNIYFSDNILKHISVCSNNGHHCKILISSNIDQPRGIALYPQNGIMFWTDWGHKPMIGKGLMDGSNFMALVTTDIHWPNCIALDQPNDRLYWVDAKLTKIESIRIDGNDRRIVLTDVLKHPYGISVFEDNLYWSDWETKSLHTCNKFTGKKHEVIAKDERIYAVHIYHSALQPKIKNPCDKMGCSHLCLLAGNITNCACPEDMILNVDQRNCVKLVKKQKLYIGLGSYLIEMEHSTFGRHQILQGYSINVFIHNMEYNSINGTIFIADNIRKIIYEFNPFTKKVNELVNKNLGNVTSMSFDNLAQNLYWTDAERHTIEVLSLRKNQRAIVHFFVGIEKPIGLVVVPDIGKMFVALQATNHTHIDTLSLHGRGPQHYTFGTKLGNGGIQLILDEPEKDIFWLDRENAKLEFANYETYFRNLFRSNLNKPYSIALVDDDILWSSRKHQSIYWFNSKHNFGSIKRFEIEKPKVNIHSSTFDEIPLLSSKPIITSIDHHCLHNNGDCSHICVSVGKFTSACICPSGMVFKDNTNKTCIESWDCEFRCQSGECLTASRKCNGHKDCADGSDEKDCDIKELDKMKKKTCCFDQFACHDGTKCIMNSLRCDKEFDCNDKSDEDGCEEVAWNCKREKDKFLCKDNDTCIPLSNVCDKVPQCPDKSDENGLCSDLKLNCQTNLCPEPSKCHQLPDTGPTCICPEGYKYDLVKRQCEDIDECQNYGICSQMCTNINGSFECSCAEKYILKNDGRTCAVQGAEPLLLYTTQKSVVGIYLKSRHVYKIADNLTQVIGVAYDGEHIYWTNIQHQMESLVRSRQDGSEQEILLTSGIEAPEDLALDWLTGNIYFSDNILKHISVCSNNGHHCKILISLNIDEPRGIALYPQNGIMFWTDWGHKPMIGKALMDGSNFMALVTTDIHWPNCIALDQPNDRLYWVDAKLTKIESIRIDGNDRRIVLTDVLKHPYGISVFEDNLYWSDWETKSLHTCNKFTGKKHEVIAKDERIYAVHIYHSALQPKIKNPCDKMGCSHLCLLAGNITNCACPEDMILNVDQRNCVKLVKKQKLYIGLGSYLIEMEHSTFGRHQISQGYSLNVFIHNMEYNSINSTIFIADNIRKTIYEFNPFTKKVNELVNKNLGNVTSMSFDNLAQNLYWTDAERHTIEVLSLRKNQRAIVHFFVGIEKPIGLVVVPDIGKMFVALQATNHTHIDTLSLHGRGPQNYTFGTKLGNGGIQLILDEPEKDIFWLDRENEKLEFANYETYFRNLFRSNLNKPYSIALVDDDILWSSRKHQSIYWFDSKHNFGSIKRFEIENPKVNIHSSTFDEIPLLSSKPIITSIDHHCLHNNGDCSHICVSVGKFTSACICPSGMVFKDNTNKTCIESWDCEFRCQSGECLTASRKCNGHKDCADGSDEKDCDIKELDKMKKKTCRFDQFACHDGTKCIMNSLRCDKEFDCNDKSDEDGCEEVDYLTKCRNNQFGCNNGRCVDLTTVCDDFDDCGDKSDERNCQNSKDKVVKKFSKNMFQCTSGQCILKDWECDGHVDCIDGSDEHDNCASKTCQKGMVQCRLGQCIDSKLICDGHNDCGDNSDELNCESEKRQILCGDELDSFGDPKKFQCTSDLTLCLDISAKCNKTAECPRGEDEVGCGGCSIYEFECHNKECIRKEFRCDNKKDCTDGSDEIDCDNYNSTLKNSLNFQNLKR